MEEKKIGYLDRIKLMKFFNRGGFVFDFTIQGFNDFTSESIGIPLCQKYNLSRGKSLEAYIKEASLENSLKLLFDLLDYYEVSGLSRDLTYQCLNPSVVTDYEDCKSILDKLKQSTIIETEGVRKGEKYRPFGLYQSSLDPLRGCTNQRYYIEAPDGTLLIPPGKTMPIKKEDGAMVAPKSKEDKVWRWSRDRYLQEKANNNIEFKKSDGVLIDSEGYPAKWNVYTKIWLTDRQEEGATPVDIITKWENRQSAKELSELGIPFDFAKPIGLIRYLITLMPNTFNSIILDFFSGSSTTAHAVMQLNAEDGGKRKYIMVQLPEETPEDSEARKSGYNTIPEIAKERIRRAGKKIKEESPLVTQNLDTGFRVFRLADSNFEEVKKAPAEYDQSQLDLFLNNVKSDRTDLDLLFGAMLSWGVQLSLPMTSEEVDGKIIYSVNDGDLVACFAEDITETIIKTMADKQPLRVLFRDSCFGRDDAKINVFETLKQLLDWSEEEAMKNIKVI